MRNKWVVSCVAILSVAAMYITYTIITKNNGVVFGAAATVVGGIAGWGMARSEQGERK